MEHCDHVSFSPEEIERIKTLPIRTVKFAGIVSRAFYDEELGVLYFADENGIPTGDRKEFKPNPAARATSASSSKRDENEEPAPDRVSSSSRLPKKQLALIACAILGIIVLVATISNFTGKEKVKDNPSQATIDVVQVTEDLLPGTEITQKMIARAQLDAASYNTLSAVSPLYSWDNVDALLGMYTQQFIPSGKFLSFSNTGGTYRLADNPFLIDKEGFEYIDIPVNISNDYLSSVLLGRYIDIEIEVNTAKGNYERADVTDIGGLEHRSSVTGKTVTDIFTLTHTPVVALYAMDGSDIYELLASFNAIPDGMVSDYLTAEIRNRVEKAEAGDDTPLDAFYIGTIRLQLSKKQVEEIGKLKASDTSVRITELYDEYVQDTKEQSDFVAEEKYTTAVLCETLKKMIRS